MDPKSLRQISECLLGDRLLLNVEWLNDNPAQWLKHHADNLRSILTRYPELSVALELESLALLPFPRLQTFIVACFQTQPQNEGLMKTMLAYQQDWLRLDSVKRLALTTRIKYKLHQLIPYAKIESTIGQEMLDQIIDLDIIHVAALIVQFCHTGEKAALLHAKQDKNVDSDLVDLLYALLCSHKLNAVYPSLLRASLKLSEQTGLFPRLLIHSGEEVVVTVNNCSGGAFSDVHQGCFEGRTVAIKTFRNFSSTKYDAFKARLLFYLRAYRSEPIIWSQLHHPNILPFYGIYICPHERFSLLSPWMDNSDVMDYLEKEPNVNRQELIHDIARGLEYLHTLKPFVIHGDLKPNNILVTPSGRACIADFGLGRLALDAEWSRTSLFAGNDHYFAPELLESIINPVNSSCSPAVKTLATDVYAFGAVCYEIYHGTPRFFEKKGLLTRWNAIRNPDRHPCPKPDKMLDTLWRWVLRFWSFNPDDRPSISEFVNAMCPTPTANPSRFTNYEWEPRVTRCSLYDQNGTVKTTEFRDFRNDDIIIALMGPTGTGKSTFINCAFGRNIAKCSNSIQSCTLDVEVYGCFHPDKPGRRVFFVDTPGFNTASGTLSSEKETLKRVASWLIETYKQDIKLSGILQFYSIAATRMTGTDRVNLEVFTQLCGPQALKNVVVVSTGWEELDSEEVGVRREAQMKGASPEHLKSVRFQRFNERTAHSAWGLIDMLDDTRRPLQIQKEMVDDGKPMNKTSAFQTIRKAWNGLSMSAKTFKRGKSIR
ncbi:kinase-like protein [Coprinopsis marcescibilis]|uniref:Kinase-like protein n=1 Tax=Coprinopsis marcescibilis TaxID=230819 RepID=A0A5C3KLP3_COPMA|nr:kinase-like protein [Coprinopsis marcescibilis]